MSPPPWSRPPSLRRSIRSTKPLLDRPKRHRVIPMPSQRMTPDQPPKRQPRTLQRPVHPVRFDRIAAARRLKPAMPAQERAESRLIRADGEDEGKGGQIAKSQMAKS